MAETTKRARSPSPVQQLSGTEAKRVKEEEEEEKKRAAAAHQNRTDSSQGAEKMSAETSSANVGAKEEEVDAVDLGIPHEGDETDGQDNGKDDGIDDLQQEEGGEGEDTADGEGPSASIAIRALIVTGDASIIIGKQGKHINEIRDKSGAKLTIVSRLSI